MMNAKKGSCYRVVIGFLDISVVRIIFQYIRWKISKKSVGSNVLYHFRNLQCYGVRSRKGRRQSRLDAWLSGMALDTGKKFLDRACSYLQLPTAPDIIIIIIIFKNGSLQ